jgi:hypothetical protein
VQQHLTLVTGLGIATRVANGMEFSSPYVQGLEQAHKIALTAWPIFFAAIVAQSLKAFATFRVERGIRLRVCVPVYFWLIGLPLTLCSA